MLYGHFYNLKFDGRANGVCNIIAMQVAPLFKSKMYRKCTVTAIVQFIAYKNDHTHNKILPTPILQVDMDH